MKKEECLTRQWPPLYKAQPVNTGIYGCIPYFNKYLPVQSKQPKH